MANICSQDDPCFCISLTATPTPTPTPSCPEEEQACCLKACNAILECTDAVGPCGQAGSVDLKTLDHVTDGCDGGVQYALESHDGFFADVKITKAGILTWVTKGPETVGKYGTICFRITCQSNCDDCITLNAIGFVEIGVNNLCRNVVCDEDCEVCDPCTGTCIEENVDLTIEST